MNKLKSKCKKCGHIEVVQCCDVCKKELWHSIASIYVSYGYGHVAFDGETIHLCSDECLKKYSKNPGRYIKRKHESETVNGPTSVCSNMLRKSIPL
jgi:YHS domain-containing protein